MLRKIDVESRPTGQKAHPPSMCVCLCVLEKVTDMNHTLWAPGRTEENILHDPRMKRRGRKWKKPSLRPLGLLSFFSQFFTFYFPFSSSFFFTFPRRPLEYSARNDWIVIRQRVKGDLSLRVLSFWLYALSSTLLFSKSCTTPFFFWLCGFWKETTHFFRRRCGSTFGAASIRIKSCILSVNVLHFPDQTSPNIFFVVVRGTGLNERFSSKWQHLVCLCYLRCPLILQSFFAHLQ